MQQCSLTASAANIDGRRAHGRGVNSVNGTAGDATVGEETKATQLPKGVPADAVVYTVGVGDSLASIALRHSMNVTQLKKWNKLLSSNVYAGQQIYVMPPPDPTPEQKRADDIRKLMRRSGLQTKEEAAYYIDEAGDFESAWAALCADNAAIAPAEVVEAEDEGWLHVLGGQAKDA